MITGGFSDGYRDSTEVLDTEVGSVTMASPMNSKRVDHGMGLVTIKGKDRLAVLGGNSFDSVELYNAKMDNWEMTDFKLSGAKSGFSFLTVKLGVILPNLH